MLYCVGTTATMASQTKGPPDQANNHEAEVIVDAYMNDQSHAEDLRQLKRQRTSSSPEEIQGDQASNPTTLPTPPTYTRASLLLRTKTGAQISHAHSSSPIEKYVLDGETRSQGNGSPPIIVVYDHNLLNVPDFSQPTFKLGEWKVTCRRTERNDDRPQYARVVPLADETKMNEIQETFQTLDGGENVELTWISQRLFYRGPPWGGGCGLR